MNAKLRTLLLVVVVGALLGIVAFPSDASANHSWGGYHWARTSNPFTLKLGDNLASSWKSYLSTTSSDWSQSTVLDTTIVAGSTTGRRCRPTSGRVEVCNSTYGNNGWLGLAQIWLQSGTTHITQGAVKVNDTYFNQSQYNNPAEKNHVMCQEVGHTLGLDHQDTSGTSLNTCMDYYDNTSASDTKSTHPNQHDYDELVTIYTHLDSSTTIGFNVGSTPSGSANGDLNTPAEWGTLVRTSAAGRASTYVRALAGGQALVTYVTWAQ